MEEGEGEGEVMAGCSYLPLQNVNSTECLATLFFWPIPLSAFLRIVNFLCTQFGCIFHAYPIFITTVLLFYFIFF